MRVLFVVPSAFAHINPIVPLAGALQGAGHEVRVATHPEMSDVVRNLGLSAISVGERDFPKANAQGSDDLYDQVVEAVSPDLDDGDGRLPSRLVFRAFARHHTVGTPGAQLAEDLVEFARSWQPDLVIWDGICAPAAIAARVTGAAHARVLWSIDDWAWARSKLLDRIGSGLRTDPLAETMRPMLDHYGLEFDEELLLGQWTIDHYPAIGLRLPLDVRYVRARPVPFNGATVIPRWLYERPDRPRVGLSLGAGIRTFFPAGTSKVAAEELFEIAAESDVELVATLNQAQLQRVSAIPENVRVIDYLPLNVLLPTCAALIHHGGSGTFAAAVPHRIPHLLWRENGPYYDDIAKAVVRSGSGLVIDDADFARDTVADQLRRILTEPSFAEGADLLYRQMMAEPSPAEIVPVLEKLTVEHCRRSVVV